MTEKKLEPDTIRSLSVKLDDFSEVLSKDEHAILLGLIGTASAVLDAGQSSAETEGITSEHPILTLPTTSLPRLSGALLDTFKRIPNIGTPGGPLSDSVGVGALCVTWSKDIKEIQIPGGEARDVPNLPGLSGIEGLKTYR